MDGELASRGGSSDQEVVRKITRPPLNKDPPLPGQAQEEYKSPAVVCHGLIMHFE